MEGETGEPGKDRYELEPVEVALLGRRNGLQCVREGGILKLRITSFSEGLWLLA